MRSRRSNSSACTSSRARGCSHASVAGQVLIRKAGADMLPGRSRTELARPDPTRLRRRARRFWRGRLHRRAKRVPLGPTVRALRLAESSSRPRRASGRSGSDLVVNSSHHRFVQLDASRRQDRDEGRPERVEGCLRFPDVEHLNLTVRFEGYVGDAAIGCPGSGFLELGGRLVLLLLRETLRGDVEPKCHLSLVFRAVCALAAGHSW